MAAHHEIDIILIDCPPSARPRDAGRHGGLRQVRSIQASTTPSRLSQLEYGRARRCEHEPAYRVSGMLLTMSDKRTRLSRGRIRGACALPASHVPDGDSPAAFAFPEAPSYAEDHRPYDPRNVGAIAYRRPPSSCAIGLPPHCKTVSHVKHWLAAGFSWLERSRHDS